MNWLITKIDPPMSNTCRFILPSSSEKMRIWLILPTSQSRSSRSSQSSMPNSTRSPRWIAPRHSPATSTFASLTRCITARMGRECARPRNFSSLRMLRGEEKYEAHKTPVSRKIVAMRRRSDNFMLENSSSQVGASKMVLSLVITRDLTVAGRLLNASE